MADVAGMMETQFGQSFLYFFCEGCQHDHFALIKCREGEEAPYVFSGTLEKPTLSREFIKLGKSDQGLTVLCVVELKDGVLNYRRESTHELSGKSAALQPRGKTNG